APRPGDGVERAPEDRRDARVRRVAQQPAERPVLDLPGDLRTELEVETLVVDRPGLVRLEVDAVADVCEEIVEGSLPGFQVEVRHPEGAHSAPPARARRAAAAAAELELRRGLARAQEVAQDARLDDRVPFGGDSFVVVAEGAETARRRRVGRDV